MSLPSFRLCASASRSLHSAATSKAPAKAIASLPPLSPHTFTLYQANPERLKDLKMQMFAGFAVVVLAGGNMAFICFDWHTRDETGFKDYAAPAWRYSATAASLVMASGATWGLWYLMGRHVKRVQITLPDSESLSAKQRRSTFLSRFSEAQAEFETFLTPHPFSSRSSKLRAVSFKNLKLLGPLSQQPKPYHPLGLDFGSNKKKTHVPIQLISRPDQAVDYLKLIRQTGLVPKLPSPQAMQTSPTLYLAKDGSWDAKGLVEVEEALLRLRPYDAGARVQA